MFILTLCLTIIVNTIVKEKATFHIPKHKKYAIFGHSHSEAAINDSILCNVLNLSESGEAYFYTFQKVKLFLNSSHTIDTVFIEFTNNQITTEMDCWMFEKKFISNKFPRFSPFMSIQSHSAFFLNQFENYRNAMSLALKKNY